MSTQVPAEAPRQSLIRHRQQRWLQIYLPLILGVIVLLFMPVVVLILNPSPLGVASAQWAAIAVIWLVAPLLVLSLLGLMVVGVLVYLIQRITGSIPRLSWWVLTAMVYLQKRVRHWGDRSASLLISVKSLMAGLSRGRDLLMGRKYAGN
jgi:hypothetical protein